MAGSAIGTALYTGQQTVGGGYKSGEVLRPCGSQTPDDASGQYDKGQAGAEADTPLLERGNSPGTGKERNGRKACRRAAIAAWYQDVVENKLKQKVNEKKSAVARPWEQKFLGYSMTWHKQLKLKIAPDECEQAEGESAQSDHGKPEQISESDNQCPDASAA